MLLFPALLWAQGEPAPSDVPETPQNAGAGEWRGKSAIAIREVPVWGRRPMKSIGVEETKLDSAILKENIALSMADALTFNTPVFVKQYGRATLSTVSFRGTGPSHTQVTWNGMRINNPMLGMTDFSMIPSYFIDDASLLHGTSSVSETGGGLGGLVKLSTAPAAADGFGLQYIQGIGMFRTFDEFLRLTWGDERWQVSTRAVYQSSANDYKYRNRAIADTWEGDTDKPGVEIAEAISNALMTAYMKPASQGGVSELYIVYTEFINMVVQKVRVLRMLPVEIVKNETKVPDPDEEAPATADVAPLYTFEPSLEKVLDAILPKYIQSRIHECLLTAAASETASRQNAMHTATDNARNLIDDLTRKLNASRQASITQELTEIIGSADALTKKEE